MPKIVFLIIASKSKPWKNILKFGPRATWYNDLGGLAKVYEVYSDGSAGSSTIDPNDPKKVVIRLDCPSALSISEPVHSSRDALVFKTVSGWGELLPVTFSALSYLLKNDDFDFVVRTNVSSYWNVPKLIKHIEENQINCTYAGVLGSVEDESKVISYASGAGIVISRDVAIKLVENYQKIDFDLIDDVAIGKLAEELNIKLSPLERLDVGRILSLLKGQIQFVDFYHFRLKSDFYYHGIRVRKDVLLMRLLHRRIKKSRKVI